MKYYVFFHLVNGHNVRMTTKINTQGGLEQNADEFAQTLVKCPYLHFMDGDNLVVVNMSNVAYIKIVKAE